MRLSIAIVNWNTTELLKQCIRAIRQHPPEGEWEVVVVDNASNDFHEDQFWAEFPDARLIVNTENAGYAKGNNQAFELCAGDYILLLNPDTQVTQGAIQSLVEFMEQHPDVAACGGKLVRPDGVVERSVRGFPYPGSVAWEFLGLSRLFPKNKRFGAYRMSGFTYDRVTEVEQPMGSCLIIRRQVLEEIGPFDEAFPIFFNEVDWLYRAHQKGYKIYFTPNAVVVHLGAASTSQVDRRKMVRESHDSLIRFYEKHFRGKLPYLIYGLIVACIRVATLLRNRFRNNVSSQQSSF